MLPSITFACYPSEQLRRQSLQVQSGIPAKRGGAAGQSQGRRAQMRQEFPAPLYGRRALLESLISVIKRTLSARAPGRSLQTPGLQALLLGIASNIYRLWLFALLGNPEDVNRAR